MVRVYICNKGAFIYVRDLTDVQIKIIESEFTIKNKLITGRWLTLQYYSYYNYGGVPCILFPRFGALLLRNELGLKSKNYLHKGQSIQCKMLANFRGNQKIVFDELFRNYFNEQKRRAGMAGAIINLEPGQGKTYVGLHVISHLQLKTVIIVHNELILKQWHMAIMQNIEGATVGLYYGKTKDIEYADIIITIINSALQLEIWSEVGLCIFDEAQLYCSKGRAAIFERCQCSYMLGLSATPEEKKEQNDNTYKVIQWNIGTILVANELDDYTTEDIPFKGSIKMVKYYGHPQYIKTLKNEKLDMVSNPLMIQQITDDPFRLQLIINETIKLAEQSADLNIFIFANRRAYLEDIRTKLLQNNQCANLMTNDREHTELMAAIMTIMGQSSENEVNKAETQARIILTTYQYFGVGKSIPRMNAMILATPFKTGTKQYIGRIFRLGSDYSITRQIVDIVDWSTTLKNQWYSRKKFYDEQSYPINVHNVDWQNL